MGDGWWLVVVPRIFRLSLLELLEFRLGLTILMSECEFLSKDQFYIISNLCLRDEFC